MTTKQQIIKIYEKELQHPSYGYIARKVKRSKTYVWDVIQEYLKKK